MTRGTVLFAGISWLAAQAALASPPHSTDSRLQISLFAEQPQIATPTDLDIDELGRVWAVECNTHFRPTNYPGHPSDRVLIFQDRDGDGRAEDPTTFADGFTATMSVAVRPAWMPQIVLDEPPPATGSTSGSGPGTGPNQVFLATRNRVMLLEDVDGDDVCDRQITLFELDTKGNYPHNGFAGFAFDPRGLAYVGLGENLGEPYRVRDRSGQVVFESAEGGNLFQFRPDGRDFRLYARGFWNPHASCFNAFGHLFTVDNDPDSRPPCRLLHVIDGGDFGYRFSNGRKGLHPFTSWNGQIPGTLPMVAGTGEAPSGIIAYEGAGLPEEYRGDLLVTSWGDHRIDRFRLRPVGATFESLAEPLIVGDELFRPVGIAAAPDGSVYCTDWVRPEYELHGHGRIWRISPTSGAALQAAPPAGERRALLRALESPRLVTRRGAARELLALDSKALVGLVRNPRASLRARFEALSALTLEAEPADNLRVLKSSVPVHEPPFDALQTLMATSFDERPSPTAEMALLLNPQGSDPGYLLAGIDSFSPIVRALGHSQSHGVVDVANRCAEAADAFTTSRLVGLISTTVDIPGLTQLIASDAGLTPALRLDVVLAARRSDPRQTAAIEAALARPEPAVRRAAVQWAAEERLAPLRPLVESSLARAPMTTDLFLATIASLEMLDGRSPQDFDKTPSSRYVVPLVNNSETPPAVLAAALRIVDADDPAITPALLGQMARGPQSEVAREAVRTLAASRDPAAIGELLDLANRPELRSDALLGLSAWIDRDPIDPRVRSYLMNCEPWDAEILRALRRVVATDGELRNELLKKAASLLEQPSENTVELSGQLELALGSDVLPAALRARLAPRPQEAAAWRAMLQAETADRGDPAAGRTVFFHPQGPGCSRCHTIDGRGGQIGPDLSRIGQASTRDKLLDSILEPSREVAPQFTAWQMITEDGLVHSGMIVHENEGRTVLGDSDGKTVELKTIDIVERRPQRTSIMPDKLADRMTVQEFRDLLAFLAACRE